MGQLSYAYFIYVSFFFSFEICCFGFFFFLGLFETGCLIYRNRNVRACIYSVRFRLIWQFFFLTCIYRVQWRERELYFIRQRISGNRAQLNTKCEIERGFNFFFNSLLSSQAFSFRPVEWFHCIN